MQIIRDIQQRSVDAQPCVASIGNFDGVHRGHQAIVSDLVLHGRNVGLPVTIVTFEPHPLEYFAGDRAPPRLMTFRQKVEALRTLSVDHVCCLRFNERLATTPAQTFVDEVLINGLSVKHLVVGDDFHFGKDRTGNFSLLEQVGQLSGFTVERAPTYEWESERISSSRVRVCLAKGDFATAASLLGQPYTISGRVIHGDHKGREYGIPTINLALHHRTTPLSGIFAVRVRGIDMRGTKMSGTDALESSTDAVLRQHVFHGAGYVGTRPTVDGTRLVLEVHLLDFQGDCYGQRVHVEFVSKIRDDLSFDSVDEMKRQMNHDISQIRDLFRADFPTG